MDMDYSYSRASPTKVKYNIPTMDTPAVSRTVPKVGAPQTRQARLVASTWTSSNDRLPTSSDSTRPSKFTTINLTTALTRKKRRQPVVMLDF